MFTYDANGNLKHDGPHDLTWTLFNQPNTISRTGATASSHFDYDADLQRLRQTRGTVETTLYLGGGHERRTVDNGTPDDVRYLSGPLGRMGQVTWRNGQHADVRYFHHDHLGSVDAITKLDGTAVPQSYDAWGERRNPVTRQSGFVPSTEERRGFTDHEHLDDVRLIHMNGRIYDPRLGRFLSVDPVFDNLGMTQGVNAYSYVRNNPVSYTDPTGLEAVQGDRFEVTASRIQPTPWYKNLIFWGSGSAANGVSVPNEADSNKTNKNHAFNNGGQVAADVRSGAAHSTEPGTPEGSLRESAPYESDSEMLDRMGTCE